MMQRLCARWKGGVKFENVSTEAVHPLPSICYLRKCEACFAVPVRFVETGGSVQNRGEKCRKNQYKSQY